MQLELVVLKLGMWNEVEVEWMQADGMGEAVGGDGYGIELETPVAGSGWNFAP